MNLFSNLVSTYLKLRLSKIRHYTEHPHEVQEELLRQLLAMAAGTEFGRKHGFEGIGDRAGFAANVPVTDYEAFRPWIDRTIGGEKNLIWPSDIRWFAKSSGTTSGRSKFIPVSRESLETCHLRGPRDLMCLYAHNNPGTRVFSGKSLILGGSQKLSTENNDVHIGDVSAVMMMNQPPLATLLRTPPLSVALLDDWEEKIDRMARTTPAQHITLLAGVPTWTLVLGRRILEITGKEHLGQVWPGLELYVHGGVNFEPYRSLFEALIPDRQCRFYQTYNASEGFFAFQSGNDDQDMLLALNNGVYYEFIPRGHYDDEDPPVLGLEDIRAGEQYALVITTNAGLWRYKPGDTVQVTSVNPYRIRVSGRTKQFVNAFGEEVIVENADEAVRRACLDTGALLRDYTMAPVYFGKEGARGAHQWLLEFERSPENIAAFTAALDRALQGLNSDYEAKRTAGLALDMPEVVPVREGLFSDWLKRHGKLGGQHKVPRLSNDRKLVEELLAMNG